MTNTYRYDKYARLYCKTCNLILSKNAILHVFVCNKCGKKLILKSFNPLPSFIAGLGIFSLGGLTILLGLPIIWIGGFIWGIQKIYYGFEQWSNIKRIDNK